MTVHPGVDSPQAWLRLWVSLAIMTIGGCGMYVVVVVLPGVQADFGISRADASLPYTLTMIGFGVGGVLMGRLGDRWGVALPLTGASLSIGLGFVVAGYAPQFWAFALAQGILIGLLGCSATFSPLMTEMSFWFEKRRGIAVAICASGNYLGGTLWPPVAQFFVERAGWRATYIGIGVFCILTMVPLSLWLHRGTRVSRELRLHSAEKARQSAEQLREAAAAKGEDTRDRPLDLAPLALLFLLSVAGVACCVAMAMPQVHIVAYCNDLGYGVTRGAQMLSTMLAFGIASRLISGAICDRIGGLRTLMLGSALQGLALLLFIPFNGMISLFVISAMFGLFQGGIVPSYAIIVREYFSPARAGTYVGVCIMATLIGMALGGWMSGKIFDATGSYKMAFVNGVAWNLLNLSIAFWMLRRSRRLARQAAGAPATV